MTMTESKRARIPRGLKQTGPALLSYGFRPFFLGGAVWAVAAMVLWIAALMHGLPLGGDYGAPLWHAHEMLFGFAPAVLAGFLLTAIPNWTGSLPVAGGPLLGLVSLWVAGRIAMAGAALWGMGAAALADSLFLPALLAVAGREIVAGRKWNDLKVLGGVGAVMAGNLGFHLTALLGGDTAIALRAAVAGYVILILIIGGRIIPSFTRNWLAQRQVTALPVPYNRFDVGVIAVSAATLALWAAVPGSLMTAIAAIFAAALNTLRLSRWRGWATRAEPLLLVLHAAYLLMPVAFLGLAAAQAGLILPASALHLFTVGVIPCTMMAVMTRATRGHTGRPLSASGMTVAAYGCLFCAALTRPMADLTGSGGVMEAAGLLWITAFGLFLAEYAPMLLLERRSPRGG